MSSARQPFEALAAAVPVVLERWFAEQGVPPALDLARSGAAALTVGELMALASPDALSELLALSLDYADPAGTGALRDAIAQSGAARAGAEVLVTHGAVEALLLTCAAVVGERRRVLVGTPSYEALLRAPRAVGADVVPVPVWRQPMRRLDLTGLEELVDGEVAAVLVNSPSNPTGATASPADLDRLASRCADAGAVLVVDEVGLGTLDPARRSASTLSRFGEGAVVVIGDLSKACGVGGLRTGWLTTASARVRRDAAASRDLTSLGGAAPTDLLATWALRQRDRIMGPVRAAARTNLDLLSAWIAARDVAGLAPPQDGLVAFPWLPQAASEGFAARLREAHGVSIVPGGLFGVNGHVRIGLGLSTPRFARAVELLDASLGRLRGPRRAIPRRPATADSVSGVIRRFDPVP